MLLTCAFIVSLPSPACLRTLGLHIIATQSEDCSRPRHSQYPPHSLKLFARPDAKRMIWEGPVYSISRPIRAGRRARIPVGTGMLAQARCICLMQLISIRILHSWQRGMGTRRCNSLRAMFSALCISITKAGAKLRGVNCRETKTRRQAAPVKRGAIALASPG